MLRVIFSKLKHFYFINAILFMEICLSKYLFVEAKNYHNHKIKFNSLLYYGYIKKYMHDTRDLLS